MAIIEITNYTCLWDLDDHAGYIGLFDGQDFKHGHEILDPAEFTAVVNLLRFEKPLYYDEENHWISAGVRLADDHFEADEA
jgi:hypothetical protein